MTINGLKLPDSFVALIDRPKPLIHWTPVGDNLGWAYRGGEGNLYWVPKTDAESDDWLATVQLFESLEEVEDETSQLPVTFHVAEYSPEEIADGDARYAHLPGFLPFITDFSKIVYFGNTDCREALCFDYRENADEPSIIHWDDAYWRRYALNFDSFISMFEDPDARRLELESPPPEPGVIYVPHAESQRCKRAAVEAIVLARAGKAAAGHTHLLSGLQRAEALRDNGEPWGASLVRLYKDALDRYSSLYGAG